MVNYNHYNKKLFSWKVETLIISFFFLNLSNWKQKEAKNVLQLSLKVYHQKITQTHDYIILYRYISVESIFLEQFTFLFDLKSTFLLSYLHKNDVKSIQGEFLFYFCKMNSKIASITKSVARQLNNNICNWNRSFHHIQANTTFF